MEEGKEREKVFLVSPVRNLTAKLEGKLRSFVASLKANGEDVYWPYDDTVQFDSVGSDILRTNARQMILRKKTLIHWNPFSEGSRYDFGCVFTLKILSDMLESCELTNEEVIKLLKNREIILLNSEEV